jgi:hypothetical protein
MKPYYCVRLEGLTWPSAQQTKLRELVETWLEAEHPFDDRGPGVSIRLDAENPEQWWRYTIDESLNGGAIVSTTITILNLDKKSTFEVRTSVIPGGSRVTPQSYKFSVTNLKILVSQVLDVVTVYDAGMRLGHRTEIITDVQGAQTVAGFFDAPSRALPIVIETMPSEEVSVFEADRLGTTLAGIAHVFQIVGTAPRLAFNEFYGGDVLAVQGLVVMWPDHTVLPFSGVGRVPRSGSNERVRVMTLISDTAAESLAPLRAPRFRRRAVEQEVETRVVEAEKKEQDFLGDPETVSWSEYRSALDGWQETEEQVQETELRVGELEQALAEADRIIAEQRTIIENKDQAVDQLILQNVNYAIELKKNPTGLTATSAIDAVNKSIGLCNHLYFHPQAIASAKELAGIDASRLLQDLMSLNIVARDWQIGNINNASIKVTCRNFGLNFAAGVGDNAEQKYGSDYAFSWEGRTEFAVAHIRGGKGSRIYRVHVFFDDDSHQVVVAYIGRHLRGKRDHS